MSIYIIFKPRSHEAKWLMSLSINAKVNRVIMAMKKINSLYFNARKGSIQSLISLSEWYKSLSSLQSFYQKELNRYQKYLKSYDTQNLIFENSSIYAYKLPISTTFTGDFYQLLNIYDQLMCLIEACVTLNLFKNRNSLFKKCQFYSKKLLKLINTISQYKIEQIEINIHSISQEKKDLLCETINSLSIPVFKNKLLNQLVSSIPRSNNNDI